MNPFEELLPAWISSAQEVNSLVALVLEACGPWPSWRARSARSSAQEVGRRAKHSNRSEEMTESAGQLKVALIAFGACAALGIIFAAILFIVGSVQG